MGPIFGELIKRWEINDASSAASSPAGAREFMKAAYPMVKTTDVFQTGHDSAPQIDASGGMSGDSSEQEQTGIDEVALDASTFDEKVRELVQSAGHQYNYKAARETGLVKRVNPEIVACVQRLQKSSRLLNEATRRANLLRAKRNQPPIGSSSGSASGSVSGSTSGDVSKVDRSVVIRALAGQIADRLRLMHRR